MFVVCSHRQRNVRIGEDLEGTIRFWSHSGALNILVISKPNIDGGVSHGLE